MGNIFIGDRLVNNVPPRDRDIAMVFQSYALYPHMTVYDNTAFGLSCERCRSAEIDRRVKEAAEVLGIEPLLERKPGQLSGGQRQRVAVARAIVREPAVFLLDEPLSNLDAKLRVHTRTEISKLHQRLDTTFVYVTHDQVEAMTMATRIAVMNLGVIQQVGTPQELYDHPVNRFVAGFIGSPAMNFLDATVTGTPRAYDAGRRQLPGSGAGRSHQARSGSLPGQEDSLWHSAGEHPRPGVCAAGYRGRVREGQGGRDGVDGQRGVPVPAGRQQPVTGASGPQDVREARQGYEVVLNMEKMHAFDPETERALFAGPQPVHQAA